MARRRPFVPIETLAKEVVGVRRWFAEIGIATSGTRLECIEDALADLAATHLDGGGQLRNLLADGSLYSALLDARSFTSIADSFSPLKSHELPRRRLREILSGPPDISLEEPGRGNVNGRNALAELELASDFLAAGLQPLGFDDLAVAFEGSRYWIEVKRLVSPRRVQENADRAYSQLKRRMGVKDDRGIVALNASRVLDLHTQLVTVRAPQGFEELGAHLEAKFHLEFGNPGRYFVDPRVLGTLVIFKPLVNFERPGRTSVFGPASFSVLLTPVSEQSLERTERLRLDRLFTALNN